MPPSPEARSPIETRDVRQAPPEKTKPVIARLVSLLAQNDDNDLDTGEMLLPGIQAQPSLLTAAYGQAPGGASTERPASERIRLHWTSSASGKAALVWTSSRPGDPDESLTFEFDARKGTVDYAMHSLIGEPNGGRPFLTVEDLERATVLAEANLVTKKRLGELREEAETKQDAAVLTLFRSYLGDRTDGEWSFRDDAKGVVYRLNGGEAGKINFSAHIKNDTGQWSTLFATIDKATGKFLYGQSFDQNDTIIGLMDRKAFLALLRNMKAFLGSVGYARA